VLARPSVPWDFCLLEKFELHKYGVVKEFITCGDARKEQQGL
jgi:hypothetical protein